MGAEDVSLRQCIRCRKSFPPTLVYFFASSRSPDGLQKQCQPCQLAKRLRNKKYREQHPDFCRASVKKANDARRLAYPEEVRAANHKKALRYYAKHPEKCRARSSAYRLANAEKVKKDNAVWSKANSEKNCARAARRRARLSSVISDISTGQREEIKAHYKYRCVYCGKKFPSNRLHLDHITPLVKQGPDTLWNYVPVCKSCNSKKKDGPPLIPGQPLLLTIAPAKKRIS